MTMSDYCFFKHKALCKLTEEDRNYLGLNKSEKEILFELIEKYPDYTLQKLNELSYVK